MGCLIVTIIGAVLYVFDIIPAPVYTIAVLSSVTWTLIASICYFKFGFLKGYYHNLLGWHTPDDSPVWQDGLSDHCRCKYCGKDIMQDSQGNWF